MVIFTVPGKPQGKARARTLKSGYSYTPEGTVLYENLIKTCFLEVEPRRRWFNGENLAVHIYARFPIPKSESKANKLAMMNGKLSPVKKPDVDNIAKVICDALNGVAYRDDAQVICLHVTKEYVGSEDEPPHVTVAIENLRKPGA